MSEKEGGENQYKTEGVSASLLKNLDLVVIVNKYEVLK